MIEFITEYWQFFVAGLILIALITYWIVERILAKKAKEKQLNEMEAKLQEEEAKQEKAKKQTKAKQQVQDDAPVKEETTEEVVEEPQQEEQAEEKKASAGIYMISYDKEKKDWVVKRRGSKRATRRTKTKKEALEIVKSLTENQDVGFVVKKKDGKFQKK